jgi:pimeloyl-ACP methyl ester carboxylesterase
MSGQRVIPFGRAELAVVDRGSGPAIVALHPGVGDRRVWEAVGDRLADRWRFVAYDRRGFGTTRFEPEPFSHVDDLATVLDALQIQRAVLLGNSMGGRVAVDFTLRSPERVVGLVLVAASIRGAPYADDQPSAVETLDAEIERLEADGDLDAANELEAQLWLDGPSRPAGTVGGAARRLFLDMNGVALHAPPVGVERTSSDQPAWSRLEEIRVPTLAMAGVHDIPDITGHMVTAAQRIPGARFVELADAAHLPQLEDPVAFADAVASFVAEIYVD